MVSQSSNGRIVLLLGNTSRQRGEMSLAEDEENPEIAAFLATSDANRHADMTTVPPSADDDAIIEQLLLDELLEDERSGELQVAFDGPDKDTVRKDVNWFGSPWGGDRSEEKTWSVDTSIPKMRLSGILRCESDDDADEMPIKLQNINRQRACDMLSDDEIVAATGGIPATDMGDVHQVNHEVTERVSAANHNGTLDHLDVDCWHTKGFSIDTKKSVEEAHTSSSRTNIAAELPNPTSTSEQADGTASETMKSPEGRQKLLNESEGTHENGAKAGDTPAGVDETSVCGRDGVSTHRKSTSHGKAKSKVEAPEKKEEDGTLHFKEPYECENNGEEMTCKSAAEGSLVTEGAGATWHAKQLTSDTHDYAENRALTTCETVYETVNIIREADAHVSVLTTKASEEATVKNFAQSNVTSRVTLTSPEASDLTCQATAAPSYEIEGHAQANKLLGQNRSDADSHLPISVDRSAGNEMVEASMLEHAPDNSDEDPKIVVAANLDDESHRHVSTVCNLAAASIDVQFDDVKRDISHSYKVPSTQSYEIDSNISYLDTPRLGDEPVKETTSMVIDQGTPIPQGKSDAVVGHVSNFVECPEENENLERSCMSRFALDSSPADANDTVEISCGETGTIELSDGSPTGAHKRASERKPDKCSQADKHKYNDSNDVASAGQFRTFKMRNSDIYETLRAQQDQMDAIRSKLDAARLEGERLKESMAAILECEKPTVTHIPDAPSTADLFALIEAAGNQTILEGAPTTFEECWFADMTLAPLGEGKSAEESVAIRPAAELFESPPRAEHVNLEASMPSVTSLAATISEEKHVVCKACADAPPPIVHEGAEIKFEAGGGKSRAMVFATKYHDEQTPASLSANNAHPLLSERVNVEVPSEIGKKQVMTNGEISEKLSVACKHISDDTPSLKTSGRTAECTGAMYREQKSSAPIEDSVVRLLQRPQFSNEKLEQNQQHAQPVVTPRESLWTPKGSQPHEAWFSMHAPYNRVRCPISTSWNDGSAFANDRANNDASNFFQHTFPQGYFQDDGSDVFGSPSGPASSAAQPSSTPAMVSPTSLPSQSLLLEVPTSVAVAPSPLPRPTNYNHPMPQCSPIEVRASSVHQKLTSSNFALPRPQTAPSARPSSPPPHTYTIQLQRPQPTIEHPQKASLPLPPATAASTIYALASPRVASQPIVWNPMKLPPPPTRAPPTAPEVKLKTVNVTVPLEAHIAAMIAPPLNTPSRAAPWSRPDVSTRGEESFATPEVIL